MTDKDQEDFDDLFSSASEAEDNNNHKLTQGASQVGVVVREAVQPLQRHEATAAVNRLTRRSHKMDTMEEDSMSTSAGEIVHQEIGVISIGAKTEATVAVDEKAVAIVVDRAPGLDQGKSHE